MEPTPEQIEEAIAHDKRFAMIDLGITLAAELRDSKALNIFINALAQEAQDCLVAFGDANVAQPTEIMPLQVRVRALLFLNRTIEDVFAQAKAAEQHVMSEIRGSDDR